MCVLAVQAMRSVPRLGLLLVGDRPDSKKYVQHKIKACKDVGIDSVIETVPVTVDEPGAYLLEPPVHPHDIVCVRGCCALGGGRSWDN